MSAPITYFLQRNGVEEGPFTTAQLNRLRQRRQILPDVACRPAAETAFRRLDEVLPHLKEQAPVDPAKLVKLKADIATHEVEALMNMAFGSALVCWAPSYVGVGSSCLTLGCGWVLCFKYRKPIGLLALLIAAAGLYLRFVVRLSLNWDFWK